MPANGTTQQLSIPKKDGYEVFSVTLQVSGEYYGHYFGVVNGSAVYFKNTHSSQHTNSFSANVIYKKI